jgi:hypothetical protein
MKRVLISAGIAAAVVGSAGTALAVSGAQFSPASPAQPNTISGCLTSSRTIVNVHPNRRSVRCPSGETLIRWNITGPAGPAGPQGPSGVVGTTTTDFGKVASVATGGSFVARATEVGTVSLKAGTYLLSLNAKATPNMYSAIEIFPQFFVYNQVKNAAFAGDLFNVGSGPLASNNTSIDSYYSGSTVITLAQATILHVYAFGYDSDRGPGTYALDDLSVTATRINTGS